MIHKIASCLDFLQSANAQVKAEFLENAQSKKFNVGQIISNEGDEVHYFTLIQQGMVRVYKIGETGREITLYRLQQGEGCILTAASILSRIQFPAYADVEETVEAVLVPAPVFRRWISEYEVWRNYVFSLLAERLSTIIATIEELAFRRVDTRIAEFLLQSAPDHERIVKTTHQEIARELGTVREVVSRILKDFEKAKIISLARGTIQINDPESLQQRAKPL